MTDEQLKLYENNVKFVPYLYNKYYNAFSAYPNEQEEFIAEGRIGLLSAVINFEPSTGYKFATYASKCIINAMLMYLRKLNKCVKTIRGETVIHSDSEGDDLTLFDVIPEEDASENMLEHIALKMLLKCAKHNKIMSNNEYKCLLLRLQNLSQCEIGKIIGITQASCSRCIRRAINKLKELYKENVWHKRKENAKSKKKR